MKKLDSLARRGNVRAAEMLFAYRFGKSASKDELSSGFSHEQLDLEEQARKSLEQLSTPELLESLQRRLKLSTAGVAQE